MLPGQRREDGKKMEGQSISEFLLLFFRPFRPFFFPVIGLFLFQWSQKAPRPSSSGSERKTFPLKKRVRERESLLYIHNRFLLVGNCFSEKIEDHDNGMDLSFWIDYVMKRPFLA